MLVCATDKKNEGTLYEVAAAAVHEQFNSKSFDYDFGLLKLKEALTFNERIQPIKMPKFDDEHMVDGTIVLVSGWGKTMNSTQSNQYLRAVEVPTVNQEFCNKTYKSYYGVSDRMFCASYYNVGAKDGQC